MRATQGLTPGRELAGNVALITGGGRNIGRAIALSLAAGGASVMVNVDRSRSDAAETVRLVEANGGKAASFIADVTDPDAVAAMVAATVERFGRIDALVNNAALRTEQAFAGDALRRLAAHSFGHPRRRVPVLAGLPAAPRAAADAAPS